MGVRDLVRKLDVPVSGGGEIHVYYLQHADAEELDALEPAARRGLALFVGAARCILCHDGPLFSDLEFHDLGLPPGAGGDAGDPGRMRGVAVVRTSEFRGVGRWSDDPTGPARYKIDLLPAHAHGGAEFRTPSLRNVAVTAPYMHHGQLATLAEVVRFYSTLEGGGARRETILLPLGLSEDQERDLVAFLESLTDTTLDPKLSRPPEGSATDR